MSHGAYFNLTENEKEIVISVLSNIYFFVCAVWISI